MRRIFRIVWFSVAAIFLLWNWMTFQSRNLPADTFESDGNITVNETDDEIAFLPAGSGKSVHVIFFQGGMADPKAYAPLCRKIAGAGFHCHLIKMSWRLPQYDYKKVLTMFDISSQRYIVGGHSQGAKMAAQLVYETNDLFKGLFLLGTSHPRDIDLSSSNIPCLKLYAEHDGLASVNEVMQNKDNLPKNCTLQRINGGNHSQFGYLGKLLLDDEATITLEQQQEEVLTSLLKFFNEVDSQG
jgi:pimeloyl-ACP methyl ester carboxylesterase